MNDKKVSVLQTLAEYATANDKGMYLFNKARFKMAAGERDEAISLLRSAYVLNEDSGLLFTLAIQLINMERYTKALETIELASTSIQENNLIKTGTRSSKLATLTWMREDLLNIMETTQ